jgi:serine/threonine protein kinase
MKAIHNIGDTIRGEYHITGFLGQGGIATTYSAETIHGSQKVAIKVIALGQLENFKMLELFEREARTLAQIDRFDIPKYIDYFHIDRSRHRLFYIVQQLAEGVNLADLSGSGWISNEIEVKQIAEKILEILIYLQQLVPPLIHRDIKPQNIIYNQFANFQDINKLFLVDFGAVQDTYHNSLTGGSTIVGTYGYMAPEQFRGQAKLGTDLYGLGATLIFLLTHKHPSELPQRKLKIDWRSQVKLDKHFGTWLDRMIEPAIEERFRSAEEALAVLQGKRTYSSQKDSRPIASKIVITESKNKQVISIPPIFFQSSYSRFFVIIPIIWGCFFLLYTWVLFPKIYKFLLERSLNTVKLEFVQSIGFPIIFFALLGLWILAIFLIAYASETHIEIDSSSILFRRNFLGWRIQNTRVIGQVGRILQANLKNMPLSIKRGSPIKVCNLTIKRRNIRFASFLSEEEKQWLIGEIQDFVEKQKLKLEEG